MYKINDCHFESHCQVHSTVGSYLQHQLRHLEALLQALVGRDGFVIEETQQMVPLQGFLIVTLVDVQYSVLSIKIGKFKAFLSIAKENQVKTQAR